MRSWRSLGGVVKGDGFLHRGVVELELGTIGQLLIFEAKLYFGEQTCWHSDIL